MTRLRILFKGSGGGSLATVFVFAPADDPTGEAALTGFSAVDAGAFGAGATFGFSSPSCWFVSWTVSIPEVSMKALAMREK